MAIRTFIIVPARSGSKGIIDKNIKLLGGKPLLSWTALAINEAQLSQSLAIISTDSDIYANIAKNVGLNVPFKRSAEYAADSTSAYQVIEHALDWFNCEFQYFPELIMWLQPTSPFRSSTVISKSLEILDEFKADAVIGCQEIHRDLSSLFNYENDFLSALDPNKPTQTARQQIKPLLTPNGAMYLCKTKFLLEKKSFYPQKTLPLIMNKVESVDIDTEEDWAIAEAFIKQGLI